MQHDCEICKQENKLQGTRSNPSALLYVAQATAEAQCLILSTVFQKGFSVRGLGSHNNSLQRYTGHSEEENNSMCFPCLLCIRQ